MKKSKFKLVKKSMQATINLPKNNVEGYLIKPKNNVIYKGILVNKLVLYNMKMIELVLKKKVKIKLNTYLKYIIEAMDNDATEGDVGRSLTDIDRYRGIILERYAKFLDEKYIEILIKKIQLIEKELKKKAIIIKKQNQLAKLSSMENEEKLGKSR